MKGYKATYDYKCRNQTYKVGKTYSCDKLEMCKHGFHFCENMKDVINYYSHNENFILLEVESLGNLIKDDDKTVTDKIKILRVVDPSEYTFKCNTYEYDDRNNMISKTYPDGDKYTFEYDDRNNMISEVYSNGDKYTFEYDDRNNKISTIYSNGNKHTYEYDDRNNKISVTYSSGSKYTYEYDDRNNKISETYPSGDKNTFEYDDRNNKISVTYPNGDKYTWEYSNVVESDN